MVPALVVVVAMMLCGYYRIMPRERRLLVVGWLLLCVGPCFVAEWVPCVAATRAFDCSMMVATDSQLSATPATKKCLANASPPNFF